MTEDEHELLSDLIDEFWDANYTPYSKDYERFEAWKEIDRILKEHGKIIELYKNEETRWGEFDAYMCAIIEVIE